MARRDTCRACRSSDLSAVVDLGITPLADGLVAEADLHRDEPRFPLDVVFCESCALVQIRETVPPEILFGADYPYFSSFADAVVDNARENAEDIADRRRLGPDSLVVELASNDGYLLRRFVDRGIPVLGIDPAPGPARAAEAAGVPTLCTFFGLDLARKLAAEGRRADVVIANNVLAHVADTNGFVAGIAELLKPDGVAVIEVPYLVDLVDHCEFDTIYHQHLCYFSVSALDKLFRRHGLHLNDVRRLPIHGGSLRLYVGSRAQPMPAVTDLLDAERAAGVDRLDYYRGFAARIADIKARTLSLLGDLRAKGRSIAGYGAAAKACTLLNVFGIDRTLVDYVVDRNVHKHGRYMPGTRQPICDTKRLLDDRPDYVLLLAWNHAPEIMRQQQAYLDAGGRFIVPIPEPKVLE